jgi:hypothetical protein
MEGGNILPFLSLCLSNLEVLTAIYVAYFISWLERIDKASAVLKLHWVIVIFMGNGI